MVVAVVGVGLIGGSIGLAARERAHARVTGWDPAPGVLDAARDRGAIEAPAESLADAVCDADLVFVAAPVGALPETVDAALAVAGPECVVSDVGSTKREIVAGRDDPRFVGGHPLAGAETSGVDHARADLFAGATWYLTPTERTSGILYERLHRFVAGLGAQPTAIDPVVHDRLMASVSHLPHVVANVLVSQAADALGDQDERLPATGPSFRDATRVAGANDAIWTDIYLANREALVERIDELRRRLDEVRTALAGGDAAAVSAWNLEAGEDPKHTFTTKTFVTGVAFARTAVASWPRARPSTSGTARRTPTRWASPTRRVSPGAWRTPPTAGDDAGERAEELIAGLGHPVARP